MHFSDSSRQGESGGRLARSGPSSIARSSIHLVKKNHGWRFGTASLKKLAVVVAGAVGEPGA